MKRLLLFFCCFFILFASAQEFSKDAFSGHKEDKLVFMENRGQVADAKGNARADVLFSARSGSTRLWLAKDAIYYQFSHTADNKAGKKQLPRANVVVPEEKSKVETHRFSVHLEGANPNAQVITEQQSVYTENYYLAHCPNGITGVRGYEKITYKNIYPNIDWVVYSKAGFMEYDFVVNPGGNPSDIKLKVKDADAVSIENGELVLKTRLGEVREKQPITYDSNGNEIATNFVKVKKSTLGFSGDFPKNTTYRIDPQVIWATYYGGTDYENNERVCVDSQNNVYLGGDTNSSSGIASAGYDTSLDGSNDMFIAKFDAVGTRIWATYYGGSDTEIMYNIRTDSSGNLYAVGYTMSTSGVAVGGFDTTYGGVWDALIIKFNSNGIRQWSTYYGGEFGDTAFDCAIDNQGNVYAVGSTPSSAGIASGGFQNTYSRNSDGFIVKFNSAGSRLWGTYYGNINDEIINSVGLDSNNNIFVAGTTTSNTGIATAGSFLSVFPGATDQYNAFLAKFTSSGSRLWGTYFGGTAAEGLGMLAVATDGSVYISGHTGSTTGIASGGFQNTFGGSQDVNYPADAYLAKFSNDGALTWSTYYGGSGDDYATDSALALDSAGNIYLSGFTSSASNIASGGFLNTYQGQTDGFIAKFSSNGARVWSSYFGGTAYDLMLGCAVDSSNALYLSGFTMSRNGIAQGGFQSAYSGQYDGFLAKISQVNCAAPVNVNGTFTSGSTASLSWAAGSTGTPSGYQYAVTTSATPPASGTDTTSTSVSSYPVSAGITQYLHVRANCSGEFSPWTTSAPFSQLIQGDVCTSAINLATLTSPYTGTTVGASANYVGTVCLTEPTTPSPDLYYYIAVPNGATLAITQVTNNYDSVVSLAYGSCASLTPITCYDDPDEQTLAWTNTTGAAVNVYIIQDGYNGSSGSFTISWSVNLTPSNCPAPTNIRVSNIVGTAATVVWAAPSPTAPEAYQVYVSQSSVTPVSPTNSGTNILATATATSYPATNLAPGTVYYYWVRSTCGNSYGSWIYGGTFTTLSNTGCTTATYGQFPSTTFTPACTGTAESISANCFASEYSMVNLSANTEYTFSSSVATDYITITNQAGTVTLATGITPLVWNSGNNSGAFRYYFHADAACTAQNVARTRFVKCGTVGCASPVALNATGITTTGAAIMWTAPTGVAPAGYEVYFSTSSATPPAVTTGTPNTTTGTSFITTTLSPFTTYYYWVRSLCTGSTGSWVAGGSFTTLGCTNATYNQYPSTTYTPSCTGANETITPSAYAGEYSMVNLTANTQYTFSSSVTTDYVTITNSTGVTVLAAGITPLVWNTGNNSGSLRYYFHTNASCGEQGISRTRYIKCSPPPCNPPTNLAASNITYSFATISWTGATGGNVSGYQVEVSTSSTTPSNALGVVTSATGTSYIAGGLAGNTQYYFWVRTICNGVPGSWVAGQPFSTLSCTNATYGQYPTTIFTPTCTGSNQTITANAYAGEYTLVNLSAGTQYTFSSSVPTDYITISNQAGTTILTSGVTPLVWNSGSNTGTFRYYFHTSSSCGEMNSSRTRYIKCSSCTTQAPVASAQTFCGNATVANLVATGTDIKWYIDATTTTVLSSSTTLSTRTYYATQTVNSCESPRVAVQVTVNNTPVPTAPDFNLCSGATVADLTATGTNIKWYSTDFGGTPLAGTTPLVSGLYFVSQTLNGCESNRNAITVNIATPSAPVVGFTSPTCTNNTATITVVSPQGTGYLYSINGGNSYQSSPEFSNLAAGTYLVYYKTPEGCRSAVFEANIATPVPPATPVVTVVQPTCAVGAATITVTSPLTQGLTYSINGNDYQTSNVFNNVPPGVYVVTAKDPAGCRSNGFPVSITPAPSGPDAPIVTATQPTCAVATGSIMITAPTGTGMTYSINGTTYQASATFTALAAGTYSVTAKNAAGCVSTATSVTINAAPAVPAAPTVTSVQPTCSVATGSITVTAPTGTGMTYSINGSTYQSSATFTGVAAGTYSVTAKNAAGCISTATSVTINAAPATPVAPTATTVQPTCSVATGSITVTAPTGTGITYSIDGVNYQASATFTALAAGTYSVTAKNAAGCVSTATSVTINAAPAVPTAPVATLVQPTCSVATGSITITAPTGTGMTYSINGTTYQASATFTGLAAGTYSVTAKNAAGCISTATSVTINAAPATPAAPTATTVQPTCAVATGSITITAPTGTGVTYSIDGSTYQASATFAALAAGTYSVTAKTAAGCISTATSVTINAAPAVPTAPVATLVQPTCAVATGSITITAPTGTGMTYSINGTTYQSSATFTALAAGTYSVTAKNASGCISTATSVTINAAPAVPAAPTATTVQPTCAVATGSITVTAPTGTGVTYSIDGSTYQASATFAALAAGTYSVTAKTAAGCISTATSVTINAAPATPTAPTVTTVQPTCSVATGSITVTAPTGTGVTYSIDGVNYQSSTSFASLTAGTYSVTAKSAAGCISTATSVTINAAPAVPAAPTVTSVQPTCSVATGSITVIAPTGTGMTYSINGTTYQASATFTALAAGTYSVTAKNAAGCISTATSVTINAAPAVPTAPVATLVQPTCAVATGSIAITAPTGTGMTYSINGSTYQASATFTSVTAGTYSVTAKNAGGCISTATSVTINTAPATPAAPVATLVQPTCSVATGSITITAPTGTGMTYSINGTTYQASATFTGLAAGTYSVTAKNAAGCISTATSVTINAAPATPAAPTATTVQPTCSVATGSITITAPTGTGMTYSINGSTYQSSATFTALAAGTYSVTAKNAAGCVSTATSVTINAAPAVPTAPVATLVQPTCSVATGSITVTAPTGTGMTYSINGSTYQASATFTGLAAGTYSVTAKNAAGCISTATSVTINAAPATPAAPTATTVQPTCSVATGSITITAPTGTGMTYSINGSTYQASATFTGLAAGTYSVTAKNAAGCISTATSVTINTAPATPSAPTATTVQPTCSVTTGSITVTAPTGTGIMYSIDGVNYQASATFTSLAAGTYSVTAKNAAGCISTATSVTINAAPAVPTAPVATLVQPTCSVATGSITVTAPTGTGMTYSINGSTYQSSATFAALAAGTYSVTAKNAAGCISTATSVTINAAPAAPPAPVATLVQPTCSVATGSITVTAPTGTGITYSIDGVNYQSSTSFASLTTGTYSVTAKNAAGCISPATSVTINAAPAAPPAPVATLVQPTCSVATGSITVTAPTGTGITYSIDGVNYQSSTSFASLTTGTYSVTAKNAAGCISTAASVTINAAPAAPPAPVATLVQPTCSVATGSITVTAPTGTGITYSIDGVNYQSSTSFASLTTGTYSVTAKNAAGCISTAASVTINAAPAVPAAPVATLVQPTCSVATGSITITAPTGTGIMYSIDGVNYQASATFTSLAAGTYSVTAKNAAGCISTATSVTINAAPAVPTAPVATLVQPTCSVATGSITITAPTGTGVTYSIDGSTYQSSATFAALAAGTYSVTAKNAAGCISTATSVTINAAPAVPAAPVATLVQPTCSVATGSITVTAPTGTGMTYSINGSTYQASATFTGLAAGTYSVTAKNAAGCISTATSVTINTAPAVPTAPVATLVQPTCSVATGSITVTAPTGTGMTYSINGSTYQSSATFAALAAGTYSVTAKNAAGCISTATLVTINAAPAVPAAPVATLVQPTCSVATGSITVTAPTDTGVTYSIDGVNYQASATFTGVAAGTYSLTAKNAAGCISTATSVTINTAPAVPTAPVATLVQPTCAVATGSVTVTAPTGTGVTYSIDGVNYQSSTSFASLTAGTYSVTAKSAAGCISTATSVTINAAPAAPTAPTVTTVQPTCSVATGSITITAPTGTGVTYSIDGTTYQASATFTGLAAGTYSVTAKNAAGCISTATSVTINAAPAVPAAPVATLVQPTCSVATGSITVTAPTGTGITYSINGSTYQASATFTALAAGTYSVTAKNAAGCISTATSITINAAPATPAAPVATSQTLCAGATVAQLTAAGTNLQWFLSDTATAALASTTELTNGTYYVSQTANGCVSQRTPVVVTINSAPVINPVADIQACNSYALPPLANGVYYSTSGGTGTAIAAGTVITASQRIYIYASNTCGFDEESFFITIIPTPVIDQVSNIVACQLYTLPQLSVGNYYTASNGQGTLLHAGDVITQTSTIYIYAAAGNIVQCTAQRSFTVTVNVTPAAVAAAQTFCGSATVANLVAAGENLTWYADATGTEVLTSTTALATGIYYVSQTINGCEGERTAVAVTINVTPAAVAAAQTFCGSATVANLVATGENLTWYADATGTEVLASTASLATGTYYVSQTINGCEGDRTAVAVTVNVTPAAVAEAQTFCGSATVANLVATGENLTWYADATGTEVLASTASLATGTYYVSQTINGCEGERTAVAVTVNVTPAAVAAAQTFCGSATVANLIAAGENLTWYADATGTEVLASIAALATGTYYVSQTVNGCEGERTAVAVTVNVTPAAVAEAQTFCGSATVASLVATGENLTWYADTTGTEVLASTTALATGTYYVSQTINGCEGERTAVAVTINVTPAAVAEAQTFCGSATVANLVATGENLTWYADATGTEVLASTAALTTGTYYVSQTINGCEGERTAVAVTVNVTPAAVAAAQTFCGSATVANLVATGENLTWYADATGTGVLASTAALATGTYYVSQTINGCEGERTAVAVTINVTPAAVAAAQTFCGSATVANLVAAGENLTWYADATGTGVLASTAALATGTYYVSQTINGCEGDRTAVEITVNVVAAPTGEATQVISVDVPADATIEDLVVMGENIQWYASVEDIQTGTPIAQGTELVSGTTYYATQTVNGCESAYLEVTVEVILKTDDKDSIKFSYYPNPVKDQLNIISGSSISLVEVYTMHGQKVISQTWNTLTGQLNMMQLEEATYIVRVYTGTKTQSFMIAKGH